MADKAKAKELDAQSLRKCLQAIAPKAGKGYSMVPVAAYFAKDKENPKWIILCIWEYDSTYSVEMRHEWIFALDAKTHSIIAESRCD